MTRVGIILLIVLILVLSVMAGMAGVTAASSNNTTAENTGTSTEITNVDLPATATEGTSANWIWLLLLAFIPLTGVVIYYFAFVREN
jgi:flagellar basal body-associated protein FliL